MEEDYKWLYKHMDPILKISDEVRVIQPTVFNDFGEWSVVKLIALSYYLTVYTNIIGNQDWVDKMRYVELLSGSGVTKIKETGDMIAGSPILAASLPKKPFDDMQLIELDPNYCASLDARLSNYRRGFEIHQKDCNEIISDIVAKFSNSDHYLAFIDCESGHEIRWDTIIKLCSKPGDILFNFQTVSVYRAVTSWQKLPESVPRKLNLFYGDDRWKSYRSQEECLDGYIRKLKEHTDRKIVIPLHIRGPGSYYYDLFLATKRTRGDNPWIESVKSLSRRLDRIGPDIMKEVLDIMKGRQGTMDQFLR